MLSTMHLGKVGVLACLLATFLVNTQDIYQTKMIGIRTLPLLEI